MMRNVITPASGPKVIGAYSAAIETENFVFTSGQLGLDPASGELVAGGIEEETRQTLTNLTEVLRSVGVSMTDVVKTTVFLKDINDFPLMNKVYAEFFSNEPPARSAFQVAALPKNARIEIEAIAIKR